MVVFVFFYSCVLFVLFFFLVVPLGSLSVFRFYRNRANEAGTYIYFPQVLRAKEWKGRFVSLFSVFDVQNEKREISVVGSAKLTESVFGRAYHTYSAGARVYKYPRVLVHTRVHD